MEPKSTFPLPLTRGMLFTFRELADVYMCVSTRNTHLRTSMPFLVSQLGDKIVAEIDGDDLQDTLDALARRGCVVNRGGPSSDAKSIELQHRPLAPARLRPHRIELPQPPFPLRVEHAIERDAALPRPQVLQRRLLTDAILRRPAPGIRAAQPLIGGRVDPELKIPELHHHRGGGGIGDAHAAPLARCRAGLSVILAVLSRSFVHALEGLPAFARLNDEVILSSSSPEPADEPGNTRNPDRPRQPRFNTLTPLPARKGFIAASFGIVLVDHASTPRIAPSKYPSARRHLRAHNRTICIRSRQSANRASINDRRIIQTSPIAHGQRPGLCLGNPLRQRLGALTGLLADVDGDGVLVLYVLGRAGRESLQIGQLRHTHPQKLRRRVGLCGLAARTRSTRMRGSHRPSASIVAA